MNRNYYILKEGVVDNIVVLDKEENPDWLPYEGAVLVAVDDGPLVKEVLTITSDDGDEEVEISRLFRIGESFDQ